MSKISIITVNYNDKPGLAKTIESVINQTFQDFEFVVIDGGSTDGSRELIEKYQDKIDYWVSEKDGGVFSAMNKGIRAATGEFVIFMNGGDCFHDTTVLQDVQPLLTNEYDIYYGENYNVVSNTKKFRTYPEKLQFSFFYSNAINHQSTFIRKSLFDDHFYYNENYKIAADWEFFAYTICYAKVPAKLIKRTIALYDFTGISSNPKSSDLYKKEKNQTFEKYFPGFAEDYKEINELKSKRYVQVQYIKKHKFAWRFLKGTISFILFFLPKIDRNGLTKDQQLKR